LTIQYTRSHRQRQRSTSSVTVVVRLITWQGFVMGIGGDSASRQTDWLSVAE